MRTISLIINTNKALNDYKVVRLAPIICIFVTQLATRPLDI